MHKVTTDNSGLKETYEGRPILPDMPHGTDRPYPIRILAFFEMIRPYHVGIRISGNSRGKL